MCTFVFSSLYRGYWGKLGRNVLTTKIILVFMARWQKGCEVHAAQYYILHIAFPNSEGPVTQARSARRSPVVCWHHTERLYLPMSADSLWVWGLPASGNYLERRRAKQNSQPGEAPRSSQTCIPVPLPFLVTRASNFPFLFITSLSWVSVTCNLKRPACKSQPRHSP